MHIDTLTNVATDSSVWVFVVLLFVSVFALWAIVKWAAKEFVSDDSQEVVLKWNKKRYYFLFAAIVSVLWLLFGAYGEGPPVEWDHAESYGSHKLLKDAPEPPTPEEIESDAEEKKSESLKEVEESFKNPSDEDDYIKRAIERSKKMEIRK